MFITKEKFSYGLSFVAAMTGVVDNVKYTSKLQIKPGELQRYYAKTIKLAGCYAGFAQDLSFDQARGAGHAAFLSCAYDVVTDWCKPQRLQNTYAGILHRETSSDLAAMAIELLRRDFKGALLNDGLERGVVATEFVLQMMRVREIFDRKCNIQQLGTDLQIVDDVLDYEADVLAGDQNCLTNKAMRLSYLQSLQDDFTDERLDTFFPYGRVMIFVIKRARAKAEQMLAKPEEYFT